MYPRCLDFTPFKHWTIPKKSGKIRHVFEFDSEAASSNTRCAYIDYAQTVRKHYRSIAPQAVIERTAYNKGVSIPMLINNLGGSKVFVQLDIVDFFNNIQLTEFDNLVPANYYYNPISKTGIKQGTNISGDIANIALLDFDKHMLRKTRNYCRYADDIMIGCNDIFEAKELMEEVCAYMESIGLEINRRKTLITDLTVPSQRYVKYLGYTIMRDRNNADKLRITVSRKKRNKWWAKQQTSYAKTKLGGEFTCFNTQ